MSENIGDILARRLKSRGLDKAALGAWVCAAALKVGEGQFEPISYKNGVLKIHVSSGARAYLIKLKEKEYISKTNTELKRDLVKKLSFEIQ